MYKISKFVKLESNNKKELNIKALFSKDIFSNINNDEQTSNYVLKEICGDIFKVKEEMQNTTLDFNVFFKYNLENRQINDINIQIIPSNTIIKANKNLSNYLKKIIEDGNYDFEETIKHKKVSTIVSKVIHNTTNVLLKQKTEVSKYFIYEKLYTEIKREFESALPFHNAFLYTFDEETNLFRCALDLSSNDISFEVKIDLVLKFNTIEEDNLIKYNFNSLYIEYIESDNIYNSRYSLDKCEKKTYKKNLLKQENKYKHACIFKKECLKIEKHLSLFEANKLV